jgi:hypothetical protein
MTHRLPVSSASVCSAPVSSAVGSSGPPSSGRRASAKTLLLGASFLGLGLVVALAASCANAANERATFDDLDSSVTSEAGVDPALGRDDASATLTADAACVTESTKAAQLPLDIYVMVDQSLSMEERIASGGSKWTAITGALTAFINQPSLAGVGVGIQYFGLPVGGKTCSTTCQSNANCAGEKCVPIPALGFSVCESCLDSCVASDYATPEVEIATLPGAASALAASIAAHKPSTLTPTSAALEGAVGHAKAWAAAHPGHVTIAVFATDGDPSECDLNLSNINAIASNGASGTPPILTYVIGVGSSFTALDGIAKAGGTTSAFTIGTTGNVNQKFLDALNKIRGAAIGCQYSIPTPKNGEILDLNTVNLQYTRAGKTSIIPRVPSKDKCPSTGEAWYYDDNGAPTQILLCDNACKNVGSDTEGDLVVFVGCSTVVK